MNAEQVIEDYLNLVKIHLPEEIADEVINELRIYIVEAATELGQGILSVESAKKTVARFGAPSQVAEEYKSSMVLEVSEITETEQIPEQDLLEEFEIDQESVDTKKKPEKEPVAKQERYHEVASYGDTFLQTIFITLVYSMLSLFGGPPGIFLLIAQMLLAGFCYTIYFLHIMGKGRILLKQDTSEWSPVQEFFTFPLNTFDEPPRFILRLDLLVTTLGIVLFAISSMGIMFFVPGVVLVGLLSIRLYCLYMRWQNVDPARFQRVEFTFQIITLAALNFSFGYILMMPWYYWMIPIYSMISFYSCVYGFYLLILLTIRSQDLWWEAVLPVPSTTYREFTRKTRVSEREFQEPTNQEPLPKMKEELPDVIERPLSRPTIISDNLESQEGPEIVVVHEPVTVIDQQPDQVVISDLVKNVKVAAQYVIQEITKYFLLIVILQFAFLVITLIEFSGSYYVPANLFVWIPALFAFMFLGWFVSGAYLHMRRYLIKSRNRKRVIGKRKRIESIVDVFIITIVFLILLASFPRILWGFTYLWGWGVSMSTWYSIFLTIFSIIASLTLIIGLAIRIIADIADVHSPDSKLALRYLSSSSSMILFGIGCVLGTFLAALAGPHGFVIWPWFFLLAPLIVIISFQKSTSDYKIWEYWTLQENQDASLGKEIVRQRIEAHSFVYAPMKVAVMGMRAIARIIIWLAVITIIATIVATLTLVDIYAIGQLINDLYLLGIFTALVCLPYLGLRYILVKRKGHSTFGRKTKGESILDALLVFPFCIVFLLKLQYYLNPYYLSQWIAHWNIVLTPMIASVTLAIRIIAMLSLALGLVLRFGSDILGLIEAGHEKTLRTSLSSGFLLTVAIGIIIGHDTGSIPESQKLLPGFGISGWEIVILMLLAIVSFQMVTTSMKIRDLGLTKASIAARVQHETDLPIVQ